MKLKKEIRARIDSYVDQRYISKTKHPTEDLYIYNYTQNAQFDKMWTPETEMCRGLILSGDGEIIARPFPKFFNLGEREDEVIDTVGVKIYEKLDGSLGILYWIGDKPYIATRGSFESDQAKKATEMIQAMPEHIHNYLRDNIDRTFLFEIIYPSNRIVVDYGDEEKLVLLAVIDTNTKEELDVAEVQGLDVVKRCTMFCDNLEQLKDTDEDNKEGYVIVWPDGKRLKIKFAEYVRLHRLVTGVNSRRIWECIKLGVGVAEMLDRVPDEFFQWVKETEKEIRTNHAAIISEAHELIKKRKYNEMDRKKAAKEIISKYRNISSVIFSMLDGKDTDALVWKMVKPVSAEQPFKKEI